MIFRPFLLKVDTSPGEVNAYVVGCSDTREGLLVDCGKFDGEIVRYVEDQGLTLRTILVTHDHADHTLGVGEAAAHFGAKVIGCTERPGGYAVDRVVGHGDTLAIGALEGRFVETSGHTPIGVSLIFDKQGLVLSGDALFAGAVGGTRTPEDFARQLTAIREHLLTLPGHFEVHSGHGPATTIAIERDHNPFVV